MRIYFPMHIDADIWQSDSLVVNLEVLFATLLEKLSWGFQWSRGFMLWPNKAMNTKFYVRTFLGPFNNQNCWNCWNCQQSHHETNTGFSVRSMFPLPRCIYMSWSAAASLSTNQNPFVTAKSVRCFLNSVACGGGQLIFLFFFYKSKKIQTKSEKIKWHKKLAVHHIFF